MANIIVNCIVVALALGSLVYGMSDCELPKDRGPCNGNYHAFYFNIRSRRCEPFVWSGCGGNGNKFYRLDECHFACHYFMPLKP